MKIPVVNRVVGVGQIGSSPKKIIHLQQIRETHPWLLKSHINSCKTIGSSLFSMMHDVIRLMLDAAQVAYEVVGPERRVSWVFYIIWTLRKFMSVNWEF